MFSSNINKKFGAAFVIFIAIMFVVSGLVRVSLGLIGEKDTALITNIRRQGGERNDSTPNRYTYSISYSFTLPNGKKVDGSTYKIGNAVYVKVSKLNISKVSVRYLKVFPQINALETDSGIKMGNIIIIGAGIIILKFSRSNSKPK